MTEATEWVSVGALGEAFRPDSNCLEYVGDLGGKRISLHFENGSIVEYRFLADQIVHWQRTDEGVGEVAEETYTATCPREGIYFVDFIKAKGRAASVSLVLDFTKGVATAVFGELPTREEVEEPFQQKNAQGKPLTSVGANFVRATVDQPYSAAAPHHQVTPELIGKRVQYIYSPTETYEHIYLNPEFYTWHCTKGIERGLCDTDLCHYYRIDANLYLFVWREKIVPTLGVVMIDLQKRKTTGKIFGYTGDDFQALTNFSIGAYASIVHVIPPGAMP
ncbi:MAG: molybdenum cofactor biosynthesis F family protein [Desulfuromonadales bacterium]|nr:molybdenum cofactor biosynthesis F family protein [Desulfuromonadales bacterium]